MAALKAKTGSLSINAKAGKAKSPKGKKSIQFVKPITVDELHGLAVEFEKNHKKDVKSLATINSGEVYLKKYWSFHLLMNKDAARMNEKIKAFFDKNKHSECFMMYQLAINAREVLINNKIKLPHGNNGDKPSDVELRALMPQQNKNVVKPNTPPNLKDSNQILALFASLQNVNNV